MLFPRTQSLSLYVGNNGSDDRAGRLPGPIQVSQLPPLNKAFPPFSDPRLDERLDLIIAIVFLCSKCLHSLCLVRNRPAGNSKEGLLLP